MQITVGSLNQQHRIDTYAVHTHTQHSTQWRCGSSILSVDDMLCTEFEIPIHSIGFWPMLELEFDFFHSIKHSFEWDRSNFSSLSFVFLSTVTFADRILSYRNSACSIHRVGIFQGWQWHNGLSPPPTTATTTRGGGDDEDNQMQ